ncbi:Ssl1-like-domain-containing protein [Chytridium lagenaria]|nr:Ssl1-like-domain-containing protein [Chytridium lagenaria]
MDDDDGTEAFRGKSGKGYLWEEEYKRSWDVLQEDEDGIVMQKRRRLQSRDTRPVQRGIIRHVCMVLDLSRAMADQATADHLRPSKLECTLSAAETFVSEFFDVNPLGSLGIVAMRDGVVERITDMTGNPSEHISAIHKRVNREVSGEPSLQNALEMSRGILLHVPSHGTREILILYGSLTSCDPGDIFQTIDQLKKDSIRVSIIGLTAEMKICKTICKETNGTDNVDIFAYSFVRLVYRCIKRIPLEGNYYPERTPPPVDSKKAKSMMIEMGFPLAHSKPIRKGFICPRCRGAVCDLPTDCAVCQLTLPQNNKMHRMQSSLSPVPASGFGRRMSIPETSSATRSAGSAGKEKVGAELPTGRFECERCGNHFCLECDLFAHEVLHNCVGCASHVGTAMPLMPSTEKKKVDDGAMEGVEHSFPIAAVAKPSR